MKNILLRMTLVCFAYAYGLVTIQYQVFPYEQLKFVQHLFFKNHVNNSFRNLQMNDLKEVNLRDLKNPIIYMTYGQSNSTNAGQIGYENSDSVFMFLDDKIYQYQDPALGGVGGNGSVWGRVGDLLVNEIPNRSIVFVNAGWGGANIYDLTYRHPYDFFKNQMESALAVFGRIDGVLFHQGESDHARYAHKHDYETTLLHLIAKINAVHPTKFFLSQTSICNSSSDKNLLDVQAKIIIQQENVLRGPNTDRLNDPKYRLPDKCHFSDDGLDRLAELWVKSISEEAEY